MTFYSKERSKRNHVERINHIITFFNPLEKYKFLMEFAREGNNVSTDKEVG